MSNWNLVKRWWARTETVEQAHFKASIKYRRRHYIFGGLLISVTTSASILQNTDYSWLPNGNLLQVLGLISPLLAALVTFLEYPKRSSQHHDAAARFSELKRSLQMQAANYDESSPEKISETMNDIKCRWDQLTLDAPALNKTDWSEIADMDVRVERAAESLR